MAPAPVRPAYDCPDSLRDFFFLLAGFPPPVPRLVFDPLFFFNKLSGIVASGFLDSFLLGLPA